MFPQSGVDRELEEHRLLTWFILLAPSTRSVLRYRAPAKLRQLSCVYLEFCILFLSTSMTPFHSYFTSAAVKKLTKLGKYLKVLRNESVMWMMMGLIVIISCYKNCVVSIIYTCKVRVSFLLNCDFFLNFNLVKLHNASIKRERLLLKNETFF